MKRGKPLTRRTPLRTDPEKARAWEARSRAELPRRTPLKAANPVRIRRLRARQFGTDGKREWIISLPSALTGRAGPCDPAHVLGTRGAGAGPEGLAPLRREEHTDFDGSMTDERFRARYNGRSRQDVRDAARRLDAEWKHSKGAEQ